MMSACMPLSMNHSPMAQPENGARYWFVAESDADAATTMLYFIASFSSSTLMTRAILDCFWPTATYIEYSGRYSLSPADSAALFWRAWLIMVSTQMGVLPLEPSPMIHSRWPR